MSKMMTSDDNGRWHQHGIFCLRPTHDPPYPICDKQCKECFELEAKLEHDAKKFLEGLSERRH